MPTWLKVLLALAVLGALGLGTCVGGVAWWANAHKDGIIEGGKAAVAEGEAFGKGHTRGACVDDALTRLKSCGPLDLVCETAVRVRVSACVRVAANDGLCDTAPERTAVFKIAAWANDECTRRRADDVAACGRVMQTVVQECAELKR